MCSTRVVTMNGALALLASRSGAAAVFFILAGGSRIFGGQIHVPRDHPTIQQAIDASMNGDSILVSPGTYHETINFNGKGIQLQGVGGAAATIIDASGLNVPAVRCENSETADTVLEGFTITGGVATSSVLAGGGGMRIFFAEPAVRNCIFRSNRALLGSGLFGYGGGMLMYGSNAQIINCAFIGNSAQSGGGAMAAIECVPTLANCSFVANVGSSGSVIDALEADVFLINSIVRGNQTPQWQIAGCCVFASSSNVEGGWPGVNNIDVDPAFVRNPNPGGDGAWGTADDDFGDLRIRAGSPCLDSGDNSAVPQGVSTDLRLFPRLADGEADGSLIVDMGAYERPRPGDIDGDHVVNVDDLLNVINKWGGCAPAPIECSADLNDSGSVNVDDLLLVINSWS